MLRRPLLSVVLSAVPLAGASFLQPAAEQTTPGSNVSENTAARPPSGTSITSSTSSGRGTPLSTMTASTLSMRASGAAHLLGSKKTFSFGRSGSLNASSGSIPQQTSPVPPPLLVQQPQLVVQQAPVVQLASAGPLFGPASSAGPPQLVTPILWHGPIPMVRRTLTLSSGSLGVVPPAPPTPTFGYRRTPVGYGGGVVHEIVRGKTMSPAAFAGLLPCLTTSPERRDEEDETSSSVLSGSSFSAMLRRGRGEQDDDELTETDGSSSVLSEGDESPRRPLSMWACGAM